MTRNNLAEHLSWLLSHVDLSCPVGPALPAVHDAAFDTSRSFTSAPSQSARTPTSQQHAPVPNASSLSSRSSISYPGPGDHFTIDDDAFADEEELVARNTGSTRDTITRAAMARLTTKPTKKPSLVSMQEQLPTPPTTSVGKLQQAYSASLTTKNGKLQQAYSASLRSRDDAPANRTTPPSRNRTPSRINKSKGPSRRAPTPDMPDMLDEEMLDLTGAGTVDPDVTSSTAYTFGSPIPLWNEEAARRVEPPPSRGRKRKSSEMGSSPRSEPKFKGKGKVKPDQEIKEEDQDDFPDVFDLVDEDLKTPAMIERRKAGFSSAARRSPPKLHMSASDTTVLTQRTVTHTRSTTETTIHRNASMDRPPHRSSSAISMVESPSGQSRDLTLPPPQSVKRYKPSSPAKARPRQCSPCPVPMDEDFMSDGGVFEQSQNPSPRLSGKFKRSDIIMDSDDDTFNEPFETPPNRNASDMCFVTAATGGPGSASKRKRVSLLEVDERLKRPATAESSEKHPTSLDSESSQSSMSQESAKLVGRTQGKDANEQKKRQDAGSQNEQGDSGSDDDGTLIMDLFKQQPHALDILEKPVLDRMAQNTLDLGRALREKWPTERRNQIKRARPPLVKQKDAFTEAKAAHNGYCRLEAKREDLLVEITLAYDADQDIDEAEARLEDLTKEIEESERVLKRALVATGITAESFNSVPYPVPQQSEAGDVDATLAQSIGATRSSSRTSTFIPECASHNFQQSQSISGPASRAVSSEQLSAKSRLPVPPFSRPEMQSSRPAITNRSFANPPISAPIEDEDMEDFLDDDEDIWIQPDAFQPRSYASAVPRTRTTTRPKSPIKARSRHQDNSSDYGNSDDDVAAMVAVAEVEQRQTPSESHSTRQRARSVFSEASGNVAPAARVKAVAKKSAKPIPKLKIPSELMQHPWSKDLLRAFKDRFRLEGFRHNQLEAINATLAGQDAFVLMPTGGGKSLCYQLPAVINTGKTRGVTIVVTPLLSLMQDQVDHLTSRGIVAKAFNGDMARSEKQDILENFKMRNPEHHVQLLYVTPEMINKSSAFLNGLQTLYRNNKFARLVIDEAHCVSQWGHDFRPDYKELGQVRQQFAGVPIIALTATATHNVIMDVKHNLSMKDCKVFSQSFNRSNLYYEIRPKERQSVELIANLISEQYPGKTGIVYTLSRKQTEQIAKKLCDHGISAKHYHAAMAAHEKTQVQRDWQSGRVKVVVATIAFGMGIDKPDVRFVVHQYLPKSLEGYYQETGRAGRDGLPSDCYLFFSHGDIFQLRKFIDESDGNSAQKERQKEMLNRVVMFCENTRDCRRSQLLHYFGEAFPSGECGKTCDNCRNAFHHETEDRTEIAKAVLDAVMYHNRLTMIQCTEILQGKKKGKDEEPQPFHGIAKGLKKYEIFRIINSLASEHALGEENRVGGGGIAIQYFIMGREAAAFLTGGRKLKMIVQHGGDKGAPAKTAKKRATKKPAADPVSTCVSSPVRGKARKTNKGKSVAATYFDVEAIAEDDEVDNEDFDPRVARYANGYAQDGFVVDDDDEEDYFDAPVPPPPKQRRQRTLDELDPQASIAAVAQPDEIQALILDDFMREAMKLEEELRNSRNLKRPLFTEVQMQQMLIQWTDNAAKMCRIPGIDGEKVRKYGVKLIPLVHQYHGTYQEMCGSDESMATIPATAGPSTGCRVQQRRQQQQQQQASEVVDLLSDDYDEDEDDDEGPGEPSKYFGTGPRDDPFQNQLEGWQERFAATSQHLDEPVSRGRSTYNKKGGPGGKKNYYKKGGGGGRGGSKSYSGVSKRKGSTGGASGAGRRTSGGSARNGASRSAASTVRKGGSGGSGIGIMPFRMD